MSLPGVVLLFHGSRAPSAAAHEMQLCERVRARGAGDPVVPGRLAPRNSLRQAVATCVRRGALRVVVVPMFLAPGGHATRDVPRLVSEARRRFPGVAIEVAPLLGAHPDLSRLVAELVRRKGRTRGAHRETGRRRA